MVSAARLSMGLVQSEAVTGSLHLCCPLISSPCAGILGENLIIPPSITQSVFEFTIVNLTTLGVCIGCVLAIIAYVKAKRLM